MKDRSVWCVAKAQIGRLERVRRGRHIQSGTTTRHPRAGGIPYSRGEMSIQAITTSRYLSRRCTSEGRPGPGHVSPAALRCHRELGEFFFQCQTGTFSPQNTRKKVPKCLTSLDSRNRTGGFQIAKTAQKDVHCSLIMGAKSTPRPVGSTYSTLRLVYICTKPSNSAF